MKNFKETLYESLLYSFGKVLAEYNTFAQNTILREVGKEIIEYLNKNGFEFNETGTIDDINTIIDLFVQKGFAELEVSAADKGMRYKWNKLYGIRAYAELHKITENSFLSCPLNACIYYIADKCGKELLLHSKTFNLEEGFAISQEEIVDKKKDDQEGFNTLIIENKRLLDISEQQNKELKHALKEIKKLRGMLPLCAKCKKIRDEKGYWNQIESYIESHSEAKFSHGLCEECIRKIYTDEDLDNE